MLNFAKIHEASIAQLTGVSFVTFASLLSRLVLTQQRGRPFKYSLKVHLILTRMKLRHNPDYRTLETLCGVDSVTASRMVIRVVNALVLSKKLPNTGGRWFIVDSTTVRVNGSGSKLYSGYKHHKGVKAQVLVSNTGDIVDIAGYAPASVHDKTLWNRSFYRLKPNLDRLILADKAYAGVKGENKILFRPVKLNEKAYNEETKTGNKKLSQIRVKVEHTIGSLKRFKAFRHVFPLNLRNFNNCLKFIALAISL